MRPLLAELPAWLVGLVALPVAVQFVLQFDIPRKWRLPAGALAAAAVALATALLWREKLSLHAYGVMLAVAGLVGITVAASRARLAGFERSELVDFGILAVLWGVVGARAFHVVENSELYFGPGSRGLWGAIAVWNGGLVFYGGLMGGMLYALWFAWRQKDGLLSLVRMYDLACPCVLLGLAFGRVGCFLNGCCFGSPSELWCSVAYPTESNLMGAVMTAGHRSARWRDLLPTVGEGLAPATYHVHPQQLYESAACIAIFVFLSWAFYRRMRLGTVSALWLLTYPVHRFVMEGWFRGDCGPAFPSLSKTLTISQYASVLGFAAGLVWGGALLVLHLIRGRRAETAA